MMDLTTVPNELAVSFRWRTAEGKLLATKDMYTDHMINVIKMVWNHSAPVELRGSGSKSYSFDEYYTKEYMITAIRVLCHAISVRNLRDDQKIVLARLINKWRQWQTKPQGELNEQYKSKEDNV